jgi:hypothetical protein
LRNIFLIFLVGMLSILGGWGVAHFDGSFQYLLFILLLFGLGVIFFLGRKTLQVGFLAWILMFILGYRTIHLTEDFALHPLVLFLVPLVMLLLVALKSTPEVRLKLPKLLWIFSLFWIWGFIPGLQRGLTWPRMISDALNFFCIIPLFEVMLFLSQRVRSFWKSATMTFLVSGVLISLLGALEYFVPLFRSLLPGFIQTNIEGLGSASGFLRASFAFFGANPAVLISALSLPMVALVTVYYPKKMAAFFSIILLLILGTGIYISGTRMAWLMLGLASLLLAYFSFKFAGLAIVALFWAIASRFFSPETWRLLLSIYSPLTSGQFLDSSMLKRYNRQEDAFSLALQNPLGVGWSGSGWVHGDFAQVAANLGLLAGLIFLGWYVLTLYRGWQTYRANPDDRVFQVILTSFILAGLVLATEGVQVLPQFAMPVWFVWGLMEAYLQQKSSVVADLKN